MTEARAWGEVRRQADFSCDGLGGRCRLCGRGLCGMTLKRVRGGDAVVEVCGGDSSGYGSPTML